MWKLFPANLIVQELVPSALNPQEEIKQLRKQLADATSKVYLKLIELIISDFLFHENILLSFTGDAVGAWKPLIANTCSWT